MTPVAAGVGVFTAPGLQEASVDAAHAIGGTSPSELSLECDVLTAGGSARYSSLIAIPIG